MNNGRVDNGVGDGSAPAFSLFSEHAGEGTFTDRGSRMLRQTPSSVSDLFFSSGNVELLQEAIRYGVNAQTGLVISRQSDVELGVVMRSIYLQEADNDDAADLVKQVRALNTSVLAFCVPRVAQEANMYRQYRRDISTLPTPLPRGELATSKGDRSLTMKSFV